MSGSTPSTAPTASTSRSLEQFGIFLVKAAQGDFGNSIWQQRSAMEAAWGEMPMTLLLAVIAMTVSVARGAGARLASPRRIASAFSTGSSRSSR